MSQTPIICATKEKLGEQIKWSVQNPETHANNYNSPIDELELLL